MQNAILRAQIEHVINQVAITGYLKIAAVVLTGWVLWSRYPPLLVSAWVGISVGMLVARSIFYGWLKGDARRRARIDILRVVIVVTALLASAIWSSAALLFLQHAHGEEFIFLSLVIAGMLSGSLPPLAAYLPGYLSFVVPTASILIYRYYSLGLIPSALLTLLYMIGLIGFSISMCRATTKAITIDLKNTELLQAVTLARDDAEKANRSKSLFFASASHDLRQPLHAMGLLLSTLRDRLSNSDAGIYNVLKQLLQSHDALVQLFNSLLQISRLESGSVDVAIVDVNLAPILTTLLAEFRPSILAKQLILVEQWHDYTIKTDPILLSRVLRNLLSNAIKFTERGQITISTARVGDAIELSIADTGIGIAAAEHDNIFQEYYQLGNSARDRNEGIGLGLSVVQKMSRLLRHDIQLVSTPGRGSCFTLRMAPGNAALVTAAIDDPIAAAITGYTVLVIDDDSGALRAMQVMLEGWQCSVIAADSAVTALQLLKMTSHQPDIIICDFRLKSGANGIEAIEAVRAYLNAPVAAVLISGDSDPQLLRQLREQQFFVLLKPVKATHLRTTMRQLLLLD